MYLKHLSSVNPDLEHKNKNYFRYFFINKNDISFYYKPRYKHILLFIHIHWM